jgi:hypothetical protein
LKKGNNSLAASIPTLPGGALKGGGKRSGNYQMKGFVGVTDNDWCAFLSQQPGIDEVNFWQPRSEEGNRIHH